MAYLFTYNNANPKAIIWLPDNICFKENYGFLHKQLLQPFNLNVRDFAFVSIPVPKKGRIKKAVLKEVINEVFEYSQIMGIDVWLIGHSDTYQEITKDKNFSNNLGRVIKGAEFTFGSGKNKEIFNLSQINVIPFLNPIIVERYPNRTKELQLSFETYKVFVKGEYKDKFENIEINHSFLKQPDETKQYLNELLKAKAVVCDIETTGLEWYKNRLLTISFTKDDKNPACIAIHPQYHSKENYQLIKQYLKEFFENYEGVIIGHNFLGFDLTFLIHEIMRDFNFQVNQEPLINQFKIDDTLLMAYLLYNSTERKSLSLKQLAFKYFGDWDKEIDQSKLIEYDFEKVATYNNIDVVANYKIFRDLWKELKQEGFIETYRKFRDIGFALNKMKMNGMRIDLEKTKAFYKEMEEIVDRDLAKLRENIYVKATEKILALQAREKYNKTHKNKKENWEEFLKPFNPSSSQQKKILFFEIMDLPVIETTKAGEPSTSNDVLEEWKKTITDKEKLEVLNLISEYQASEKIKTAYLKNMIEGYVEVAPNDYRIFANFNQSGTISGRLSSSGVINMQTIPSGSKYGKEIKKLFIAPDGFLLGASDYSALNRTGAIRGNSDRKAG